MKFSTSIIAVAIASTTILCAQTSPYADLKKNFDMVGGNLQKMAEAMPEADYSYKPTPEMRTFGALMAHVADVQAMFCTGVSGAAKPATVDPKGSKASITAALKNSTSLCDSAFDSLTPAIASQPGPMGFSKLGAIEFNTGHSNEEYGYGSVYLRLKGVTPPSSAGRGGR